MKTLWMAGGLSRRIVLRKNSGTRSVPVSGQMGAHLSATPIEVISVLRTPGIRRSGSSFSALGELALKGSFFRKKKASRLVHRLARHNISFFSYTTPRSAKLTDAAPATMM